MTKSIQHVSLSEIETALGRPLDKTTIQNFIDKSEQKKSYVEKLTDKEITDFFQPFGFIAMIRENFNGFPAIEVICEDFDIAISDYDVAVNFDIDKSSINPKNPFDFESFVEYCNTIDTTPEQALSEIIKINLLGQRFHSYGRTYEQKKQQQRKNAFESLPKSMKKLMKVVDEKKEAEISASATKLAYGDYKVDQQTNI